MVSRVVLLDAGPLGLVSPRPGLAERGLGTGSKQLPGLTLVFPTHRRLAPCRSREVVSSQFLRVRGLLLVPKSQTGERPCGVNYPSRSTAAKMPSSTAVISADDKVPRCTMSLDRSSVVI